VDTPNTYLYLVLGATAQAQTFTETDFLRQSKFCEAATRLPWGDVDRNAYFDCMERQGRLRSKEERRKDDTLPRTPWALALDKSSLWATDGGCESWASKQPENSPPMHAPGIWTNNHAWNLCMEQQGILTRPTSRSPTPKEPDFRAMVAEQRTMTIVDPTPRKAGGFQFFGCLTTERYKEIEHAVGGVLFLDLKFRDWGEPLVPADPRDHARKRRLIENSADCRFWEV
jgi:hypothetical protein